MTCRWCGRPLRASVSGAWVHDGVGDSLHCLSALLQGWLWPAGEPTPVGQGHAGSGHDRQPAGRDAGPLGAELAGAHRALDGAVPELASAADGAGAARAALDRAGCSLAAEYERLAQVVEAYRGEVREIADQLGYVEAAADTVARRPTPSAAITTLSSVLGGIDALGAAILRSALFRLDDPDALAGGPLAADPPCLLLAEVADAHDRLAAARTHLDRAREAASVALTTLGLAGDAVPDDEPADPAAAATGTGPPPAGPGRNVPG